MDIKIWTTQAPELPLGKELEEIFERQNKLNYIDSVYKPEISKELYMKLFKGLSKIYTLYINIVRLKNKPDLYDSKNKVDYLYNFNYETSLILSYIVDLMRASNITTFDILNYYETLLKELKLGDAYFFENNVLQTAMQYARHNNIMEHVYNNPDINLRPSIYSSELGEIGDNFIKAGRVIDPVFAKLLGENLWDINYTAILAIDQLPNDIEKDFEKYQNQLMEVWLYFFKLLDLLGHDWDSIGRLYSVLHYSLKTKTDVK